MKKMRLIYNLLTCGWQVGDCSVGAVAVDATSINQIWDL